MSTHLTAVDHYAQKYDRYRTYANNQLSLGCCLAAISVIASTILIFTLRHFQVSLGLSVGSGAFATAIALSVLGIHYRSNIQSRLKELANPKDLIGALTSFDERSIKSNFVNLLEMYTLSDWRDLFMALNAVEISLDKKTKIARILLRANPPCFVLNFWALKSDLDPTLSTVIQNTVEGAVAQFSMDSIYKILIGDISTPWIEYFSREKPQLIKYLREKNPANYHMADYHLRNSKRSNLCLS